MIYQGIEFDITATRALEEGVTIPTTTGFQFISVEDATAEEIVLINQIKDYHAANPVEIPTPTYIPTEEEKLRADIDYLAAMIGVELL